MRTEANNLDSKQALAKNLRKNIYDLGMTQAKYAKEIGIPITTIQYAISGKGSVSLNTLDKIAYGAGIDPWELIRPSESK
jgi:transcriptional regulator with XRE-family HTH domain